MNNERGLLRSVAWEEVFPWILLLRALKVSLEMRKLLLGAVAILVTWGGWWLLAALFTAAAPDSQPEFATYGDFPVSGAAERTGLLPLNRFSRDSVPSEGWRGENPLLEPWQRLTHPFVRAFDRRLDVVGYAFYSLAGLWAILVWALFGGALSRMAAVAFTREDRLNLGGALGHARKRYGAYVASPLLPLVGVLLCVLPMMVVGGLMRWDAGTLVGAILWPLVLIGGFLSAMLLVGLLFGWPLMWGAVATEEMDSWDAVSRSFAYVTQRPFHYLFYAIVATVVGVLGFLVVSLVAQMAVSLALWGASWGTGVDRMKVILEEIPPELVAAGAPTIDGAAGLPGLDHEWTLLRVAATVLGLFSIAAPLLALGFSYSYFWTASTGIYLLLRRDTDGTSLDEVHYDEPAKEYELPALKQDAAGATVLADGPSAKAAAAESNEKSPPDGASN